MVLQITVPVTFFLTSNITYSLFSNELFALQYRCALSKLIHTPYFEDSKYVHLALRNCSVYLILRSLDSGMGI